MKHLTLILIAFGMLTVPMQAQLDSLNIPADCPCTEEIAPVCVELPDGTVVPLPNACIAECLGLPLAADQTCTTWVDWNFPGDTLDGPDPGDVDDDAEGDDDDDDAEGDDDSEDADDDDSDDDDSEDADDDDSDDDDSDDDDLEGTDDDNSDDDDLDDDGTTTPDTTGGAPFTWNGWNFQLDGTWDGKHDGTGSDLVGDWNRSNAVGGVSMTVWPNPAMEVAYVDVAAGASAIEVITINGTRVHAQGLAEVQRVALPLQTWKPGTYVVRILTCDGEIAQRLLQVVH